MRERKEGKKDGGRGRGRGMYLDWLHGECVIRACFDTQLAACAVIGRHLHTITKPEIEKRV